MAHAHDHHAHHDHLHGHAPATFGVAFAIGTALNAAFVVAEIIAGFMAHSMALIGDAGHNLGDVLGLALAWLAGAMARRGPSARFTYGLGRGTILAALLNAGLLLIAVGAIGVESIRRLITPGHVAPLTVAVIAGIGIVVNGGTALLFAAGRRGDLNLRGAFAHMAGDAVISAGVVAASLVLWRTGWQRIDPAVSLVLALLIAWSTRGLLAESLRMSFDAVPEKIDLDEIRAHLAALPCVLAVHDLHVWPMSTTRAALTCHLVTGATPPDGFAGRISADLHDLWIYLAAPLLGALAAVGAAYVLRGRGGDPGATRAAQGNL